VTIASVEPGALADAVVRRLTPADAAAFRDIRLAGLAADPRAFSADWGEEAQRELAWFAERLGMSEVFGVDDGAGGLCAITGLAIPANPKQRHKGHVWGVYVRPEARGRGLAAALLAAVIAAARGRVESLHLGVGTYNLAAIRVYGAAGFVGTAHEARALRVGDAFIDEITMSLDLR
jgi:RimJ/RimL family protein N-acetyltransferase